MKNTLATVQSLAEQTLKSADTPEAFASAFNARLLALAKAHDLLTREAWQAVYLNDIAQAVLAAWIEDGRVSLEGPAIRISPKQALALEHQWPRFIVVGMQRHLFGPVGRARRTAGLSA